jgi:hypothetical protein
MDSRGAPLSGSFLNLNPKEDVPIQAIRIATKIQKKSSILLASTLAATNTEATTL